MRQGSGRPRFGAAGAFPNQDGGGDWGVPSELRDGYCTSLNRVHSGKHLREFPETADRIEMRVAIASLTASAELPVVMMTSTFSLANSAAISAPRSLRPSARRCSIVILRPSIQLSSRSLCWKAAVHGAQAEGGDETRTASAGHLLRGCPGRQPPPRRRAAEQR